MASLVCSITGVFPEEPVYSKTGYVFEKRIIEDHLKSSNHCPISGEELNINEVYPIKANKLVKPRVNAATSIPGLLSLMQTEWDSLMVEAFDLRNEQITLKHQLSQALYQHDAACRVVGRLLKERDTLKQQLSQLQGDLLHLPDRAAQQSTSTYPGLSNEVIESFQTLAKTLMAKRKRPDLQNLISKDDIQMFQERASYILHSSMSPGITTCCLNLKPLGKEQNSNSTQVYTGGVDGSVSLFDLEQQQTIGRLTGHLKSVNEIISHPDQHIVLTCSDDKSVRVWIPATPEIQTDQLVDFKSSYVLRKHTKAVTSISLHPSGEYFTTSSKDNTWGIHELHSGQTCNMYTNLPTTMKQIKFHPDGVLSAGAGADSNIYIYDLRAQSTEAVSILEGHTQSIQSIAFSENGYYFATASSDQTVKLWDLRKSMTLQTLDFHSKEDCLNPAYITFDRSGSYLSVAGQKESKLGALKIYNFASRTQLDLACSLDGHKDMITCACFGQDAKYLISSSMDRQLKVWAQQQK